MSTTTKRTGDVGQNFQQMTTGETPCSVSLSTNAKGAAQFDVKLVYADPDTMARSIASDLNKIIAEVRRACAAQGVTLAGQEGK